MPEAVQRAAWGQTRRQDTWWVEPLIAFIVFTSFIVYATYRAFAGGHYWVGNYLSPFFSPELWGASPHAFFGNVPSWLPAWLPYSPALLILPFPGGFRLTCYYYRGAYYKSHWADPPSCAVGEPRGSYRGENSFPLIVMNLHRYFLYAALIFLIFLSHDAWKSMWFLGNDGHEHFGVGIGTIILTANVVLLAGYTFGCHSLRHLTGGLFDVLSNKPLRKKAYECVSWCNKNHMRWAWFSLFGVVTSDVFINLLSRGIISDVRFI
ncbi:MAG: succinate dehydrogenase [Archangiaceae bacterium]|nr:succinate dehydrogenase [Archangiaceae bacterium]